MDFKTLLSSIDTIEKTVLTESAQSTAVPLEEKAVSKKQQKFMGMVYAAKKGEKPASKEVAKAAKGISKKEAKKFASTKRKDLPTKKKVSESVTPKHNPTLSFKECLRFVKESGGQQQIDPIDDSLWSWSMRVAESKYSNSLEAEAFAASTYERMGGKFKLFDIMTEQK